MKTGAKLIYFDNSATSGVKPPEVIHAVANTMRFLSANPGRGSHPLAIGAATLVYNTRKKAAKFFGLASPDRVVFTYNCTDALNNAILGCADGHVITTAMEHNSVLRPLHWLKKQGKIRLTVISPNSDGIVSADMVAKELCGDTRMVAVTHMSNVTGAVNPIADIGCLATSKKILFLVDAAQSAGYLKIDMSAMNIDLLCVAGHKGLHGPQGIGLLLCGQKATPLPTRFGGTGTASDRLDQPANLPESLESGTLATPNIAGLNAAFNYCTDNFCKLRSTLNLLGSNLWDGLSRIGKVRLYSPPDAHSGVVSFNIEGLDSVEVSTILAEEYAICTRPGLHCAPLIHKHLGTLESGAVRASLSGENTYQEVLHFLQAVKEIAY